MRIQETVTEVKRFLRVTQDSFDSLAAANPGSQHAVAFAVSLQTDAMNDSETKSLLASIERAISQFSSEGKISVQLDINHQNGLDAQLLKDVRSGYETSKKIEGATSPTPEAQVS